MKSLAAGGVAIAVALGPPLHGAAEELFAAHMVQHLVLVAVAAPLFAAGLPGTALLVRLPPAARRSAGRWLRRAQRLVPLAHAGIAGLVVVWLLHVATLWAWHAPASYEAALRWPALHALEHASLLLSATAFWAMVLRPRDHRGVGAFGALLSLFAGAGQSTTLGALLTLTTQPSYPSHAATAARWGLTPLEDQHLAGLIMWVLGGVGYLVVALVVLVRVLRHERGLDARQAAPAVQGGREP
jgi:putative membrane protein